MVKNIYLNLEVINNVGYLTLNRPKFANALNLEFTVELLSALKSLKENQDVRAILLCAEGPIFCAGVELSYIRDQGKKSSDALQVLSDHLHQAIITLAEMPKPVVCMVSGVAAGAGLGLALACDLVISGEKSRFTTAFTTAGLSPDSAVSWFLPRVIGYRRAKELLLTARMVNSTEALALGLVDRIVSADSLADVASAEALKMANGPTKAYGLVKKLLDQSFQTDLHSQMAQEARMIVDQATSPEGEEGMNAFFEKRPANFH